MLRFTDDFKSIAMLQLPQGRQILCLEHPVFRVGLRTAAGEAVSFSALDATDIVRRNAPGGLQVEYAGMYPGITVTVFIADEENRTLCRIGVENQTDLVVEYTEFPSFKVADPIRKGSGSAVLYPYNEGALIEDGTRKPEMTALDYPSCGNYSMFPNMVFAQFLAYLHPQGGLYMGLEDEARGEKGIDFKCDPMGTEFRFRIYTGAEFGQSYTQSFDTVLRPVYGTWEDAAQLYRQWFEDHKPADLYKVEENPTLPAWYKESQVVVTYPVRGYHDMDLMEPNGLFPYENAMPILNDIKEKVGTNIMALLMHWEGTAPWAPPMVWPPYGGEEMLNRFRDRLHEQGDLLGVYCSGIGWTEQSNLIADYNTEQLFREKHMDKLMCKAPDGSLPHSNICMCQRSGYDICPAAEGAQELLHEALDPLFTSGIDYAQVLDQNHGGGMYLCYDKDHGHPPVPGPWMVKTMQKTLASWKSVGHMQLGCESSCSEPFLPYLTLSDNRFELCYYMGVPVPLFAYLYHEYLHNFMGNQVACNLDQTTESLCHRIAYSFVAGDLPTLVIDDTGELSPAWGTRDFSVRPDKETVLSYVRTLMERRKLLPEFCGGARMIKAFPVQCNVMRPLSKDTQMPAVLTSAWAMETGTVQLLTNYTDKPVTVCLSFPEDKTYQLRTAEGQIYKGQGKQLQMTIEPYSVVDVTVY
jgi:hypothetical protein